MSDDESYTFSPPSPDDDVVFIDSPSPQKTRKAKQVGGKKKAKQQAGGKKKAKQAGGGGSSGFALAPLVTNGSPSVVTDKKKKRKATASANSSGKAKGDGKEKKAKVGGKAKAPVPALAGSTAAVSVKAAGGKKKDEGWSDDDDFEKKSSKKGVAKAGGKKATAGGKKKKTASSGLAEQPLPFKGAAFNPKVYTLDDIAPTPLEPPVLYPATAPVGYAQRSFELLSMNAGTN